jgi:hypothetical protein
MSTDESRSAMSETADRFADVDSASFRLAMRELAGGVAVVTVGSGADITGFTATSVASLCADPPRLLVCVAKSSASWQTLQRRTDDWKPGGFRIAVRGAAHRQCNKITSTAIIRNKRAVAT